MPTGPRELLSRLDAARAGPEEIAFGVHQETAHTGMRGGSEVVIEAALGDLHYRDAAELFVQVERHAERQVHVVTAVLCG